MAGRYDPIPPGWFECPPIGEVSDLHHLIPMKVPLGNNRRFPNMAQLSRGMWTPEAALLAAHEKVTTVDPAGAVGMVLDLSNSDKYYDPEEFRALNVGYVKVPCRGRGQSPDPLAVNIAVWEIRKLLTHQPNLYILVHCTHGYNRSGFVIVCAALRLLADQGFCVERLLRRFAQQRPPGIYKHDYITDLFRRHNEHRPQVAHTPPLPHWKPADDDDEDEHLVDVGKAAPATRLTHSDKIGEAICMEEARFVLNVVYDIVMGQDMWQKRMPINGFPHMKIINRSPGDAVIGSQPVSLDRQNLELLRLKRYFVTWKADGTRYLILLTRYGTYLIDRAGEVRRVHMRFPSRRPPPAEGQRHPPGTHPVGPPHDYTLLDGEMVVDDVDPEGLQQRRRCLIYDALMMGGEGVADLRFQDRYKLIEKEVVRPREEEKNFYKDHRIPNFLYDWNREPFSIRRKEFWPLFKGRSLLEKFIPQLCHESDGLILQPWDDPYIPKTFPHLLKWKFPHMNSVDFKLSSLPGKQPVLMLNCAARRKFGQADINHRSLGDLGLGEQRVEFPESVDPVQLHGKIVECSFDPERRMWMYMRDRPDKLTANHRSVFEKVMTSITDNITEEELLGVFDEALQLDIYKEEQLWKEGRHPSQLQHQGVRAADGAAAAAAAGGEHAPQHRGYGAPAAANGSTHHHQGYTGFDPVAAGAAARGNGAVQQQHHATGYQPYQTLPQQQQPEQEDKEDGMQAEDGGDADYEEGGAADGGEDGEEYYMADGTDFDAAQDEDDYQVTEI